MEYGLCLNVIIIEGAPILQLFASMNEALILGWNAFLVLDFLFDLLDAVRAFHLQSDGFAGQCLDEDLHGDPDAWHGEDGECECGLNQQRLTLQVELIKGHLMVVSASKKSLSSKMTSWWVWDVSGRFLRDVCLQVWLLECGNGNDGCVC